MAENEKQILAALAEDEQKYADELLDFLERFGKDNGISIECRHFGCGEDLLASDEDWDLIFLDIEMPGLDGMSTARKIRERNQDVLIVFITQMAQYAMAGYEVSALDYVLKPVNYSSFSIKMQRYTDLILTRRPDFVIVASKDSVRKISAKDLLYIEVLRHTISYHLKDEVISSTGSKTISSLEVELKPSGFIRCNQCYLVNTEYIQSVQKDLVILTNGESLKISRGRKKAFMQALLQSWGR